MVEQLIINVEDILCVCVIMGFQYLNNQCIVHECVICLTQACGDKLGNKYLTKMRKKCAKQSSNMNAITKIFDKIMAKCAAKKVPISLDLPDDCGKQI